MKLGQAWTHPQHMRNRALSKEQVAELAKRHQAFQAECQIRMVSHEGAVDQLEASSGEWHLGHRQSHTNQEAMKHQIQAVAQAIQREVLEKLTLLVWSQNTRNRCLSSRRSFKAYPTGMPIEHPLAAQNLSDPHNRTITNC